MGAFDTFGRVASPKTIVPAAWMMAALVRRREGALEIAVGTSLAVFVADVLKDPVSRHRPRLVGSTPWISFPSGRSAASTAYLVGLALVAPLPYRAAALGAAARGATVVNALRVLARQHWPSDVLAGDAIGVAAVATAHVALDAIRGDDGADRRRGRGTGP